MRSFSRLVVSQFVHAGFYHIESENRQIERVEFFLKKMSGNVYELQKRLPEIMSDFISKRTRIRSKR